MPSSLQIVSEQFPHLRERVACLFEREEIFRELCEDYEACTLALGRQGANEGLKREYSALRLRLETELLGYLGQDAQSPVHRQQ
jgi:hypothetical protein